MTWQPICTWSGGRRGRWETALSCVLNWDCSTYFNHCVSGLHIVPLKLLASLSVFGLLFEHFTIKISSMNDTAAFWSSVKLYVCDLHHLMKNGTINHITISTFVVLWQMTSSSATSLRRSWTLRCLQFVSIFGCFLFWVSC